MGFLFIFCQIFAIFDDFSKWSFAGVRAAKLWKVIKYGAKNFLEEYEEKALFNLSYKPIFRLIPSTRKPNFGDILDPSLLELVVHYWLPSDNNIILIKNLKNS